MRSLTEIFTVTKTLQGKPLTKRQRVQLGKFLPMALEPTTHAPAGQKASQLCTDSWTRWRRSIKKYFLIILGSNTLFFLLRERKKKKERKRKFQEVKFCYGSFIFLKTEMFSCFVGQLFCQRILVLQRTESFGKLCLPERHCWCLMYCSWLKILHVHIGFGPFWHCSSIVFCFSSLSIPKRCWGKWVNQLS